MNDCIWCGERPDIIGLTVCAKCRAEVAESMAVLWGAVHSAANGPPDDKPKGQRP